MQTYDRATTQAFSPDQVIDWYVQYWDTPFLAMEGGHASGGIVMDVREPLPSYPWSQFRENLVTDFDDPSVAYPRVVDGRTDLLLGYWAGGAPAHHGVTTNGRLAYRFRCYLRTPDARAWFSSATAPAFFLAFAGQGRVAVDRVLAVSGGGARSTILPPTDITEAGFLQDGFTLTSTISGLQAGDYLEIFYIQDASYDPWGGFVVKVAEGSRTADLEEDRVLAAEAPILGCGLFDDDRHRLGALDPRTLKYIEDVEIRHTRGQASSCDFSLPLLNPVTHDGFGWEWQAASQSSPGQLRMWDAGAPAGLTIRRKRLVRVWAGWKDELYSVFTGLVHDYGDPDNGLVRVQCQSFEARMLDRYDKNLPDKISYMARGYNKLGDTVDPIYDIPAYDNWPLEHAILDQVQRAGIDASLYSRVLTVSRTDGITFTPSEGSVVVLNPLISLSTNSLTFTQEEGSGVGSPAFVTVSNAGTGSFGGLSATTNASWLSVSLAGGVITVTPNATGLQDGTYNGTVTITDPLATNSPQTVAVTLVVSPLPFITLSAYSLSFSV